MPGMFLGTGGGAFLYASAGKARASPRGASFMARLQAQFLQGKLCDTILRCVVLPEAEDQEQSSSSKKRKATDTEAPCPATAVPASKEGESETRRWCSDPRPAPGPHD